MDRGDGSDSEDEVSSIFRYMLSCFDVDNEMFLLLQEFVDETIGERIWGLTEALPNWVQRPLTYTVENGGRLSFGAYNGLRHFVWIAASTAMICLLPVMFENERVNFEEQQIAQQRQAMLGPSAAFSSAQGAFPGGLRPS